MLQWLQPHRREKCFAKPEEVIQSSQTQYAGLSFFYTVKNGVLRYTLIGVVEEVLFQHPCLTSIFLQKNCSWVHVHNVGIHSTGILLEIMEAKQGCWNSTSSTTPIKVYRNTPFLTVH